MTMLYRAFHYALIPVLLRLVARVQVEGQQHLGGNGPLIVVSNHVDNWDTYIIGLQAHGRVINYLARADGLRSRWLGWYWRQLGAIPADRDGVTRALTILKHGGAIGVFPEGQIAPALVRAVPGSALLALRSGVPVVPAAIWGSERIGPWSWLRPARVTLRFGPPRTLNRRPGPGGSAAVIDQLMSEIAAMLPRRYRGVYPAAAPDPPA